MFTTRSEGDVFRLRVRGARAATARTPLSRKRKTRRGSMMIELLFVLPIILFVLLAMIQFSLILTARQQLQVASREGARVAALGGDETQVDAAVQTFLGTSSLSGATITVLLTDGSGNPLPSGSPVAVTVSIPLLAGVPNLIGAFGAHDLPDTLTASTVMRKE